MSPTGRSLSCSGAGASNVAAGSTLRTVAGVVAVDAVTEIDPSNITEADAVAAGASSAADVVSGLRGTDGQPVFKIDVSWAGPDPREALRADDVVSTPQLGELRQRLVTMDKRSRHGAWTHPTLRLIEARPGHRAQDLAEALHRDKDALKLDIRKLKNLGLTRSLDVGYEVSPRAAAYLAAIGDDE